MRILILGDLSNVHVQKQCQWLVDHDIDILPVVSTDPKLIAYKVKVFNPMVVHAIGKLYCDAIRNTVIEIGLPIRCSFDGPTKCVNTTRFRPGYSPFRRTFAKSEIGKVILVANHMYPEYHYETIVDAFKQVLEKYPDTSLVFHNPGENVQYQDKITALISEDENDISDSVFYAWLCSICTHARGLQCRRRSSSSSGAGTPIDCRA